MGSFNRFYWITKGNHYSWGFADFIMEASFVHTRFIDAMPTVSVDGHSNKLEIFRALWRIAKLDSHFSANPSKVRKLSTSAS